MWSNHKEKNNDDWHLLDTYLVQAELDVSKV